MLASVPRPLSWKLSLYLMFGHYRVKILWFMTCLAVLLYTILFHFAYTRYYLYHAPAERIQGKVTGTVGGGKRPDDPQVSQTLRHTVAYQVQGKSLQVTGFSEGRLMDSPHPDGELLTVRFSL